MPKLYEILDLIYRVQSELSKKIRYPMNNDPDTVNVFFSSDIFFGAWKEYVLAELYRENIDTISFELIEERYTIDKVASKIQKNLKPYLDIVDNIKKLGFNPIVYEHTIVYETYHFGLAEKFFERNKDLISFIDKFEDVYVYSPVDLLSLSILKEKYGFQTKLYPFYQLLSKTQFRVKIPPTKKIAFQESCILARRMGYGTYGKSIEKALGIKNMVWHPLSGKLTVCCGEFMWLWKPIIAINNAIERIKALNHIGAKIIIVACPSALALFRVAQKVDDELSDIEIYDLAEYIVNNLGE